VATLLTTVGRPDAREVAQVRRRRSRLRKGDVFWAYVLILPTVIGLGVFSIWPTFQTFYFSFTEWGSFGGNEWTGLDNYVQVFRDPQLGQAFLNTIVFSAITLVSIPVAIVLAAMLNRRGMRGVSVYRTLYFLPVVTLPAAVALVWKLLYNGDYGIINWLLSLVGITGAFWLSDPSTAIVAVSLVSVWSSIGYNMVLFLAGLQSIPAEMYEAAQIDGAGPVRQFFSVTLPLLTPTTFFVSIITVINALQAFDLVYLMVGRNNPAIESTKTVVYLFYEKGIIQNDGGYAAAIAFVLLAVILVITYLQFRVQRRWVHYG
jgi:multiple sugar transport system permease protein